MDSRDAPSRAKSTEGGANIEARLAALTEYFEANEVIQNRTPWEHTGDMFARLERAGDAVRAALNPGGDHG